MAKRTKNPWPSRSRSAIRLAEKLVALTGNSCPIDLNRVAAHRAVRRIKFAPLLVDGGLAVRDDGFTIYVRCDFGKGDELTARFAEDGTGSTLPETIRRRARFTVAHEIAHTFGYDLRRLPPAALFDLKIPASIRRLELMCNRIAGMLLLPESWFTRQLRTGDWLDPKRLSNLATKALVSRETLTRQLRRINSEIHPEGIIACVENQSSVPVIRAISRHYRFKDLFPNAKPGASLRKLIWHSDLLAFSGQHAAIEKSIFMVGGKQNRFRFQCEPNAAQGDATFFLTVRLLD
jgi:IrrE N-terminal-like domain